MNILIAAPLYPPEIGGPSQYAAHLEKEFISAGHTVHVEKFSTVRHLPTGLRHLLYFFRVSVRLRSADWCLVLDTFSVALPAVLACKLMRKKVMLRTGGDFLWEGYVERTGALVLFRNFYTQTRAQWNAKDNIIFRLTKWALRLSDMIVFSTDWQRRIWEEPYQLDMSRTAIVNNYIGVREESPVPTKKEFVGSTRDLKWKNQARLRVAFSAAQKECPEITLDTRNLPYEQFMKNIAAAYAVILVSLGDISPNLILDAVRLGKPFILTRETGLYEMLKDVGVFVDPMSEHDIAEKIVWLADDKNYQATCRKVLAFQHTYSWTDISKELLTLMHV